MKEDLLKKVILVAFTAVYAFLLYYIISIGQEELDWSFASYAHLEPPVYENDFPLADEVSEKSFSALFFGDLMIDRHVGERIEAKGIDYLFENFFLASTSEIVLSDFDLVSVNLEGAVTNGGEHYPPANAYDFAFSPDRIADLKNYGFNFFNLANNHFSDQGERGIIETRTNLDALQIDYVGCKDREVGECSGRTIDLNGVMVGMAGFSMVYGLFDLDLASRVVAELKSASEFVIVNIHWGAEYEHYKNRTQQATAYRLIDSGADLIIGHHPHVIQGIEIYKNRPIFYSLGNFVFDQYFQESTQRGLGVSLAYKAEALDIAIWPLESRLSQVSLSVGAEREKTLSSLTKWSELADEYALELKEGKLQIIR
jgi:gamma-polyglutamate biosynthesis protein CapA